jgi:hypothetical protein
VVVGGGTATGDWYEYTSNQHLFCRSVSWLDNETDDNADQEELFDNCKYDDIDDNNNEVDVMMMTITMMIVIISIIVME